MAVSHLCIALLVILFHSTWSDHPMSAWMGVVYVELSPSVMHKLAYIFLVAYMFSPSRMASHSVQLAGSFLAKSSQFL